MSGKSDGAPPIGPRRPDLTIARAPSRRRFIQGAIAGVLAPAALPAAAQVCAAVGQQNSARQSTDCEELLARYGSEFGDVRRVR